MVAQIRSHASLRRGLPAFLVVGALALSSCSASSGDTTSAGDGKRSTTVAPGGSSKKSTTTLAGKKAIASGKADLLLPLDAEAPDGYRMITTQCDMNAPTDKGVEGNERYASPIVFAVPTDWTSMGKTSGGSGSVTGTGIALNFDTPKRDRVKVEYDWDQRDENGKVLSYDRKIWKSIDYDSKIGDSSTTITYDNVAKVKVGKQDVDIFYRDPVQSPKHISDEQYKARIDVAEFPHRFDASRGTQTYSFVVTVSFDSDATEVTQKDVESIIGSFSMPTCVWDDLVVKEETDRNVDLNGDGKIKSQEEVQQELMDKLDELKKKNESAK